MTLNADLIKSINIPGMLPRNSVWEKCPFLKTIKKIWNAAKSFFQKVGALFQSGAPIVNTRLQETLDRAKLRNRSITPLVPPKVDSPRLSPNLEAPEIQGREVQLPAFEKKEVQDFYDAGIQMLDQLTDVVFDDYIAPELPLAEAALKKLQEIMERSASEIIDVGAQIAGPLSQKMESYGIKDNVDGALKEVLHWALKSDLNNDELKTQLQDKHHEASYIEAMIHWLRSDLSQSLYDSFPLIAKDETKIKDILKSCIIILADQKIKKFHEKLQNVTGNLGPIIKGTVKANAQIIGDLVLRRTLNLVENTDYTKTYNRLLKLLVDHSEGVIQSEKARRSRISEEKKQLQIAQETASQDPSALELWKLLEIKANKKDLTRDVNERLKEAATEWLEEAGDEAAKEAYKALPVCHPDIEQLKLVRDENPQKNAPQENIDPIEKIFKGIGTVLDILCPEEDDDTPGGKKPHLFNELAGSALNILFPEQTVVDLSGKIHKVDGLVYAVGQIEYPKEIGDLFAEGLYISQEILKSDDQKKITAQLKKLQSKYGETIEKWLLNKTREHIKNGLVKGLSALFETFIIPEKIDQFTVETLLPSAQGAILEASVRQLINQNMDTAAPLLFKLMTDPSDVAAHDRLNRMLYAQIKKMLKSADKEFDDLKINTAINHQTAFILAYFEDCKEEIKSDSDICTALTTLFKSDEHGSNNKYGNLVVNLAFGIGDLNSAAEYFSNWFKDILSKQITSALHQVESSPDFLIHQAAEEIKAKFNTPEGIRELFKKKPEPKAEDIRKKLDEELAKTSKVAHDLIMHLVDGLKLPSILGIFSAPAKNIAKGVIKDANHLNQVVTRIYTQMFGDRLRAQNMMVKAQGIVSKALLESADAIAKNPVPPKRVKRLPSLIPGFLQDLT